MTIDEQDQSVTGNEPIDIAELRRRQRSRANIMALGLVGFVALIFFVTIAKMGLLQ